MKTQSLFVSILILVALLATATPAVADARAPVGDKIGLYYSGSKEFPAGAPFYIQHGWIQSSEDEAIGAFDFKLEVDGVYVKENFKTFSAVSGDPDQLVRLWLYNFPEGMTGTHTFIGHWIAPCQFAVDWLGYTGFCATPNAKVDSDPRTVIVTFVP